MLSTPHLQSAEASEALLRTIDAARQVGHVHQYFVWQRLHLHRFVPHELSLCLVAAAPGRPANVRLLHSVPLPAGLAAALSRPDGGLWHGLRQAWRRAGQGPVWLMLADPGLGELPVVAALRAEGWQTVLVHGVDEDQGMAPGLLHAFLGREAASSRDVVARCEALAVCLPSLHFAAVRALLNPLSARADGQPPAAERCLLSQRELEVLRAVRGARHNAQIGEQLGISPLTVKNHLRNIMRKLGVCNRAQAVGEAMTRGLLT